MEINCVLNRRSVRQYTEEAVSKEDLELLLKAGLYAPSARNVQPWEFVVVQKRETLDALAGVCEYWKMLAAAPLAILVAANMDVYEAHGRNADYLPQDCAASTQNILVCAEGLDLGAVWLGVYTNQDRMDGITKLLKLPENIVPFSLISIGHPASHPAPHQESPESRVHYEVY